MNETILLGLTYGVFSGSVFAGIAAILIGQDTRSDLIVRSIEVLNKADIEEVECNKCGKTYDSDRKSCPYCGFKDE